MLGGTRVNSKYCILFENELTGDFYGQSATFVMCEWQLYIDVIHAFNGDTFSPSNTDWNAHSAKTCISPHSLKPSAKYDFSCMILIEFSDSVAASV